jgi:predicted PurR-regulated permease PerM
MDQKRVLFSVSSGTIIKILLLIGLAYLLFQLRDVLLILLTAVVFATAIEPLTVWLKRRGIPRLVGVSIIYLISAILIAGLFYLLLPAFLTDLSSFISVLPQYITTLNVHIPQNFGFESAVKGLSEPTSLGQTIQNIIGGFSGTSGGVLATLSAIFGGFTSFLIILVLSFYLAVQDHGIEDFLRLVIPLKQEDYIIDLWRRTQHKIARWMQGQLLLALIVGVLVYIGLSLVGVKNAFSLALISMVFEVIPVFGPIIGAVPGVMTAIIQGGFTFALIVALIYVVIQQIESNVIYPLVVKKVVDVHPLTVIIALIVGAQLGGFLGILLSVPVATALSEFMSDYAKNKGAARALLNDNG